MTIRSIQGDDNINLLCNTAMRATLIALQNEGKITLDDYEDFVNNHIAVFCPDNGGWVDWLKRVFKEDAQTTVVVCRTYPKGI